MKVVNGPSSELQIKDIVEASSNVWAVQDEAKKPTSENSPVLPYITLNFGLSCRSMLVYISLATTTPCYI